ncbi:MAG: UMP kinase [Candidatus Kerfeldbacteria bacterium]|nr:UMP kinase [Candidatus Kerfeldbacteria bacterium]
MTEPLVISLGGSVVVPEDIHKQFIRRFASFVRRLARDRRVGVVCGGGYPSRQYVRAARRLGVNRVEDLHWIGIRATQLNAELVRAVLQVRQPVVTDYQARRQSGQRIVVGAGARPGVSTDFDAVLLALRLGAQAVFNVTNVDGVYTADPRRYRRAERLTKLSWADYRKLFGSTVRPGAHFPFDPVAARAAARANIKVVVLSKDLLNLKKAVAGEPFRGTRLGA